MRIRLVAISAALAIVATALLASPASAQSASFTNTIATASTSDFDITSVDTNITGATLTLVMHTQNLAGTGIEELDMDLYSQRTFDTSIPSGLSAYLAKLVSTNGTALTSGTAAAIVSDGRGRR